MDPAYINYLMEIDPKIITLNFTTPEGIHRVTFGELDHWLYRQCQGSIVQGVRLGSGIVMMLALYLLSDKRDLSKKLFHFANQAALFFMSLKSMFYLYYYLSDSGSITTAFSGYYIITRVQRNMTATTDAIHVLEIAAIEFVLLLQINTLYKDFQEDVFKYVKKVIIGMFCLLSVATIAMYITDITYALINSYNGVSGPFSGWKVNVPIILFLSSVWFACFSLVLKFCYSYWKRRRSGIKNYSYGHIIFIIAFQSMIVPAAVNAGTYAASSWTANSIPEVAVFITVIFLPLSTMWAGAKSGSMNPYSDFGYVLSLRDNSIMDSYITTEPNIHDAVSSSSNGYQKDMDYDDDAISPSTVQSKHNWDYDVEKQY